MKSTLETLATGGLLVAAGSILGLTLLPPVAMLLFLVLMIRICWLEENIHTDLLPARRMPAGYAAVLIRRAAWWQVLTGRTMEIETCPRRLAGALRLQVHALNAAFFGVLSTFVALQAVDLVVGDVLVILLFLGLALRRVDQFVEMESILRRGTTPPEHMLRDRGLLARAVVNTMMVPNEDHDDTHG